MDNFKAVYAILSALEKAMDLPEFDVEQIGPEALGVSRERWAQYIEMLLDSGYVKGVLVVRYIHAPAHVEAERMRITLEGLEYLRDNPIMQELRTEARRIKEVTPGI